MLHCKGFVPGFYLVLYVFPVCFVPICLWPAFILEHNTYITQPGRSQQIEFSTEKKMFQMESELKLKNWTSAIRIPTEPFKGNV